MGSEGLGTCYAAQLLACREQADHLSGMVVAYYVPAFALMAAHYTQRCTMPRRWA